MLKALVVEQDKEVIRKIQTILTSQNFTYKVVNDCDAGFQYLSQHGADIHLMVLNIDGDMDGLTVAGGQRKLGLFRPVIGLSPKKEWQKIQLKEDGLNRPYPRCIIEGPFDEKDFRQSVDDAFSVVNEELKSSCRVLVVDDCNDIRHLLSRHLIRKGYEPYGASDGKFGLREIRRLKPDVILLDMRMGGLDGYKVAESIKSDEKLSRIFVIAITGDMSRDKCLSSGCDEYFEKPIDIPALFSCIEERGLKKAG